MRSLRFPNAALLPRKHEGGNESGGTCFTARSRTFIGSSMKSMRSCKPCGCLPFATAQGARSKRLNWCSLCTRPLAEVGELAWDCRFGRNNYAE